MTLMPTLIAGLIIAGAVVLYALNSPYSLLIRGLLP